VTSTHHSAAMSSTPTVYLHIGTPKSGTTYLQSRLVRNRERAAAQGLLWPGPGWGKHVQAARELVQLRQGREPAAAGAWAGLLEEIKAWDGHAALVSMEWLVRLKPHQIRAAVESLQPCRVEVVVTVRDLLRSVVAQWQEMTKNYRPWSWDQFVTEMLAEDPEGQARRTFWEQHEVPQILGRWLEVRPADQLHLVTVPPSGADPGLLWTRFCEVLGIDGSDFAPPTRDNASLGVVSTVLMQRLNVDAESFGLTDRTYKQLIHNAVGRDVLASRRKAEGPIGVRPEVDAWAREQAPRMVEEIRALGVPVVGDLDELLPGEPLTGRDPSTVTESELLALCTRVVVELGASQHERIQELRDQGERPRPGGPDGLQDRVHEALGRIREAGLQRVQRRLGRG
jgi:hypothetical protein